MSRVTRSMVRRRQVLGLVGAIALGAVMPVKGDMLYTDPLNRFAITVPDDWVRDQTTVTALIGAWSTNGGSAQLTVLYTQVAMDTRAEDLEASVLPAITALPGYTENDRRYVMLIDGEVPLRDYYMTGTGGNSVRVQQIFATHGLDGFVLTFRSPAGDAAIYATVVGAMIGSFTYTVTSQ